MLNNELGRDVISITAIRNTPFERSKCQVISMPFVERNYAGERCRKAFL